MVKIKYINGKNNIVDLLIDKISENFEKILSKTKLNQCFPTI